MVNNGEQEGTWSTNLNVSQTEYTAINDITPNLLMNM